MDGSKGFNPFANINRRPVRDRESNEFLPARPTVITALNLLLFSILIPLALVDGGTLTYALSLLTCLTTVVVNFASARKTSHAVIFALALGLSLGMFAHPLISALIFGATTATGSAAALVCSGKKVLNLAVPFVGIAAFVISLVICKEPIIALTAVIPLIPVFALGFTTRKKVSLSTSVVCCAAVTVAVILAIAAYSVYSLCGSLDLDSVNRTVDAISEYMTPYVEQSLAELLGMEATEAIHSYAVTVINTYINSAPGLIIAACLVFAYLSHKVEFNMLYTHGVDEYIDEHTSALTVSLYSAVIFIVALVLSFTLDPYNETSIVSVVASNICTILFPALFLMATEATRFLPAKLGPIGLILSGLLVLAMIAGVFFFPMLIPLIGAFYVIVRAIDVWAKEHYSKGENQ